ncbi:hypothetical protein V2S66_24380 [Streptomyces sp. V4-01]|uniref:Uncharacterized protein n=1 Tax=Actinacidiphila polyblastidii TaxID=3110430 RepID=A0ABU7PJ44_9ACTN|nr:hypothetical protein [Streptomyces sp. V4-01]
MAFSSFDDTPAAPRPVAQAPALSRRAVLGAAGAAAAVALGAGRASAASLTPAAALTAGPLVLDGTVDAVGICYSVWHNLAAGPGVAVYDNTDILNTSHATGNPPAWGPLNAFHYWGRPATGYYRSDDVAVLRTHASQLSSARVDFVVVDATNVQGARDAGSDNLYYSPMQVLLDTWHDIRSSGGATPYVVPWVGTAASSSDPAGPGRETWNAFYASGAYDDLFVAYQGKPLLLTTDQLPDELRTHFTLRKMWGLQGQLADQEWSFLQDYPQQVGTSGGAPEQLAVCTALQHTYMTAPDAVGRQGGRTFRDQWSRAFDVRPKVAMLTWWNEWMAQRFQDGSGNTLFVDNYDEPYSRDIEPMDPNQSGTHSDIYYQWMKLYINAYKNHDPFPTDLIQS